MWPAMTFPRNLIGELVSVPSSSSLIAAVIAAAAFGGAAGAFWWLHTKLNQLEKEKKQLEAEYKFATEELIKCFEDLLEKVSRSERTLALTKDAISSERLPAPVILLGNSTENSMEEGTVEKVSDPLDSDKDSLDE